MMKYDEINLIAQNIAFERNYQTLFSDINLNLRNRDILHVKGANGSGKTTLLRILAGLLEPTYGNIQSQTPHIHYLGHHEGLKAHLTAFENLKLSCALKKRAIDHLELTRALDRVGLAKLAHRFLHSFSAGQSRRLSLAILLLQPLPIWILDEPMNALDQSGQQLFMQLLEEHLESQGMVIMTTHHDLTFSYPISTLFLGKQYV